MFNYRMIAKNKLFSSHRLFHSAGFPPNTPKPDNSLWILACVAAFLLYRKRD